MKIIVATKNKAKIQAVKTVFSFDDIISEDVDSLVSSKPLNYETLIGAVNRCKNAKNQGDLVISIEGGYFEINDEYFLCDICCIKDNTKYKIGNGPLFTISKNMFDCAKCGVSLNDVIKEITGYKETSKEFKQNQGIIGYLTNGKYSRDYGSILAVQNAKNADYYDKNNYKINCEQKIDLNGENFDLLNKACANHLQKNFSRKY